MSEEEIRAYISAAFDPDPMPVGHRDRWLKETIRSDNHPSVPHAQSPTNER